MLQKQCSDLLLGIAKTAPENSAPSHGALLSSESVHCGASVGVSALRLLAASACPMQTGLELGDHWPQWPWCAHGTRREGKWPPLGTHNRANTSGATALLAPQEVKAGTRDDDLCRVARKAILVTELLNRKKSTVGCQES